MEMAALLRFACRDRYDELVTFARTATHTLQKVLCQYQSCEERSVEELAVVLRKQVVFESSCLANEQYDIQLIFRVIEAVDRDRDLEAFIHAHDVPFPGADVRNTLQSLGLSFSVPLPAPPPPYEGATGTITHTAPRPSSSFDSSAAAMVLDKGDLPNLSSPSPHVVPATTVLRLLRGDLSGSRTLTPPLPPSSSTLSSLRIAKRLPSLPSLSSLSMASTFSSSKTSPLHLVPPSPPSSSISSRTNVLPPPSDAPSDSPAPTPAAASRTATSPAGSMRTQPNRSLHLGAFDTPKSGLDDTENEDEDKDERFTSQKGKPTAVVMAETDIRRNDTPSPLLPLEEVRTADGGVEYRL